MHGHHKQNWRDRTFHGYAHLEVDPIRLERRCRESQRETRKVRLQHARDFTEHVKHLLGLPQQLVWHRPVSIGQIKAYYLQCSFSVFALGIVSQIMGACIMYSVLFKP